MTCLVLTFKQYTWDNARERIFPWGLKYTPVLLKTFAIENIPVKLFFCRFFLHIRRAATFFAQHFKK